MSLRSSRRETSSFSPFASSYTPSVSSYCFSIFLTLLLRLCFLFVWSAAIAMNGRPFSPAALRSNSILFFHARPGEAWSCRSSRGQREDKEDWKKTRLGGHVRRGRYRENECSERWRALEKLVAPPTSKPRVVKGQLLVASRRDYFHRTCANENRVINKST